MSFCPSELLDLNQHLEQRLLQSRGPEAFRPGFERIRTLFSPWQVMLQKRAQVVTVAGTNGKGETAHRLAMGLRRLNKKVALWTSPHLLLLSERMQGPEGEISLQELANRIDKHIGSEKLAQLSYYEFLFWIFCEWISEQDVDFIILEVGMGGRLDTVNVFDTDLVLLTSIGRDHMEYLGPRLEDVLKEKVGVARPGKKIISALDSHYLLDQLATMANQSQWFHRDIMAESILLRTDNFSLRNQVMAMIAINELLGKQPADDLHLVSGPLFGRVQTVTWGKATFILVGSHNPQGMRLLLEWQDLTANVQRVLAAFSDRRHQDWEDMRAQLRQRWDGKVSWVIFDHPKNLRYQSWAKEKGSEVLIHGLDQELDILAKKEIGVLVTGSYYFLGHFLRSLSQAYNRSRGF